MGVLGLFRKKDEDVLYKPFDIIKIERGKYNNFLEKFLRKSTISLIIGRRGSGKTALGMKILETFRKKTNRPCYVIGFRGSKLPRWIKKADKLEDVPNNSVVLFDEGAILFSSRDSMKDSNKYLSKIMAIARHRGLSLLVVTQNSGMLELNVLRLSDSVFLKEPSLLQSKFERKALKDMYDKVGPMFNELPKKERFFYVWDDDIEGMLSFDLPEFWGDDISKSFKDFK